MSICHGLLWGLDILNLLQIASHIASRTGNADHLQVGNINFYIIRDRFSGGMQKLVWSGVREYLILLAPSTGHQNNVEMFCAT